MPVGAGTITKIYMNPKEEDQYNNVFNARIQLDNQDYYELGGRKEENLEYKVLGYRNLREGDKLQFMYDENKAQSGKIYRNVKVATLELVSEGSGPEAGSNSGASQGGSTTTSAKSQGNVKGSGYSNVGVAVGAAMNQSIALHAPIVTKAALKEPESLLQSVRSTAIELYYIAEELKTNTEAGDISGKKQEQQAQQEQAQFNDDEPF